jgi:hypothetical protein
MFYTQQDAIYKVYENFDFRDITFGVIRRINSNYLFRQY